MALDRTLKASKLEQTLAQLKKANDRLEGSADETIFKLSRAAEYRDDEGGDHLRRVSHYCAALAHQINLTEEEITRLKIASQLHDVGKVGIPDSILLKPGRFTEYEREVMKQHTIIGARILADSSNQVIQMAEEIALTHHEKWDGSGYPHGLSGEEIPLCGRIVAVADVFDALTTARHYKSPWSLDDAFGLLKREAGAHFDPSLVEAFLAIRPTVEQIRTTHTKAAEQAPEEPDQHELVLETMAESKELLTTLRSTIEHLARHSHLPDNLKTEALKATLGLGNRLGALGQFRGLKTVRRLEAHLKKNSLTSDQAPRLAEMVTDLENVVSERESSDNPQLGGSILVFEPDPFQREALVVEAMKRDLAIVEAEDLATAKKLISLRSPSLLILEVALPDSDQFLDWLGDHSPDTPLVVLSSEGEFSRRLEVARRTSAIYLHKPVPASAVFDEIEERFGTDSDRDVQVLALDDDRLILKVISRVLKRKGFQVETLSDPLFLWSALSEGNPDILLLDLEMPMVNGFDICRVLRSDLNHRHLPILVLTAHQDFENYQRALEAGADDVLIKPLEPARLVSRIRSRLDRNQALRQSTARDPLTGLMELRGALKVASQMFALAVRNGLSFSVCGLALDRFDDLADQHGWRKGAEVMRTTAQILERACQAEDILVRHGHSRFLLFLHGADGDEAAKKITSLNSRLGNHDFGLEQSIRLRPEVASYPDHGTSLNDLLGAISAEA